MGLSLLFRPTLRCAGGTSRIALVSARLSLLFVVPLSCAIALWFWIYCHYHHNNTNNNNTITTLKHTSSACVLAGVQQYIMVLSIVVVQYLNETGTNTNIRKRTIETRSLFGVLCSVPAHCSIVLLSLSQT